MLAMILLDEARVIPCRASASAKLGGLAMAANSVSARMIALTMENVLMASVSVPMRLMVCESHSIELV